MRYKKAAVWLLAGVLAGLPSAVQTVEAAGETDQTKPAASSAAQSAGGKAGTAGTAMDEAAWEAALAAGAAVSAVHGAVTPQSAAEQAPADANAAAGKADAAPTANVGAAQAENAAAPSAANEQPVVAAAAPGAVQESAPSGTPDGCAAMPQAQPVQQMQPIQQTQPVQQMQQESAVVQSVQTLPTEAQAAKTTAVPNAPARVQEIMQKFRLSGNPRSGAYSWVYTSPTWTAEAVSRPAAGSSYFLLAGSENLRFQSFDCDEVWYFHEGCGMRLTALLADGAVRTFELGVGGAAMPMVLIPKGQIFAAENIDPAGYSFISCMTVPALETAGIRVWQREELLAKYPQAKEVIERYTDAPWGAARTQETAQAGGDVHG